MNQVSPFIAGFRSAIMNMVNEDYFSVLHDFAVNREKILRRYNELLLSKINGFFALCNYVTGQYEYVSETIKDNLGYDVRNYTPEQLTEFTGKVIHEKHGAFMVKTFVPIFGEYIRKHATAKTGLDFRFTICCKLRNIYGDYHWYLLDTAVVQADDTGFPITTLITCTNIHYFKKDECLHYSILQKNSDGVYEVVLEGVGNDEINEYNLTPREIQVINLIGQGYSNKKIAEKLVISVHTVQTHRKRIISKVKCQGTAELTNFAFSRGLL